MSFFRALTSIIESEHIGDGTKVWDFSKVMRGSSVGRNCVIGQNVSIGPDVCIGDGCKIQNNVSVYQGVTLEDDVFCGPSMVFTNVLNPRAFVERKDEFTRTLVKKGAAIGANATIVGEVTIGRYAMVGAGSVVTRDVRDYTLVFGVPAEERGYVCECGEVLTREIYSEIWREYDCGRCSKRYKHVRDELVPIPEN